MIVYQVPNNELEEWDAFAAQQPAFALMQSWGWGEFKQKMGWEVFRVAVKEQNQIVAGAQVLIKKLPIGLGSIAYIPRGPLCDWTDEKVTTNLLTEIHRLVRQHKAVFLKIEPPLLKTSQNDAVIRKQGFRQSPNTNQPRNTIILDIDRELEEILAQMRKKTRQYIRKAEGEGITIRVGTRDDLPKIIDLLHRMGRRENFPARSEMYYKSEWEVFSRKGQGVYLCADYEGKLVAVRTANCFGDHSAEFHAGFENGDNELHVNYLLVWEAIKWAKGKGCKTFDLWGIPEDIGESIEEDEKQFNKRSDGLWGVYHFKSGFCKNVVSYVGAYDFVYAAIPYAIYAFPILNRDTVERIAVWGDKRVGK